MVKKANMLWKSTWVESQGFGFKGLCDPILNYHQYDIIIQIIDIRIRIDNYLKIQ